MLSCVHYVYKQQYCNKKARKKIVFLQKLLDSFVLNKYLEIGAYIFICKNILIFIVYFNF